MQDKIEAILAYQEAKNQLVLELTGIELIPDYLKLSREDLTEKLVNRIKKYFAPNSKLDEFNCLHCIAHPATCIDCSYTKNGNRCGEEGSIFDRVELQLVTPNNNLYNIGQKLKEELDKEIK